MVKPVVAVLATDKEQAREISELLRASDYPAVALDSFADLHEQIGGTSAKVLLVDLDQAVVDNAFFRNIKKRQPGVFILALSSASHHPDLQEAIRSHIYACLAKPLDHEELLYWLWSISEQVTTPQPPK
jgi:DNA-binding NtrC family response regulator